MALLSHLWVSRVSQPKCPQRDREGEETEEYAESFFFSKVFGIDFVLFLRARGSFSHVSHIQGDDDNNDFLPFGRRWETQSFRFSNEVWVIEGTAK